MISKTNSYMGMIQLTLRQMFRSRKFPILLVITCAPVLLIAYAMTQPDVSNQPYVFLQDFVFILFIQIILLLVPLLYATSLIRDEISNKTISFLVTRNLTRGESSILRYLAHLPISFSIVALPVILCYLYVGITKGGLSSNMGALGSYMVLILVGVIVYSAFFYLLGILLKHPLMIGLLFAFLWEVLLTNMPGRIPYVTIMFYIRSIGSAMMDGGIIGEFDTISLSYSLTALVVITVSILFIARRKFSRMDLI